MIRVRAALISRSAVVSSNCRFACGAVGVHGSCVEVAAGGVRVGACGFVVGDLLVIVGVFQVLLVLLRFNDLGIGDVAAVILHLFHRVLSVGGHLFGLFPIASVRRLGLLGLVVLGFFALGFRDL